MDRSPVGRFIPELRRRRVPRVAAAFAVVAWILIEVTSVVGPALRLPEWTTTFVVLMLALAFPVVLVLAWAFEWTPEGVRRTEPGESALRAGGSRMRGRTALIAGMTILVLGAGTWWFAGDPPPAEASASAVAVLPFAYHGSDRLDYLGNGMVDLLTANLNGAGDLRGLDPHGVTRLTARSGEAAPDVEHGRAMARELSAGLYVIGSITEAGGQLRANATMLDLDGTVHGTAEASADGEAEVFQLVDSLARQLLADRLAGTGDRFVRLAARTTHSVPALKAYLEGQRIFRSGDWRGSIGPLQQAIALDSTFALAYYRLAIAESWLYELRRAQAAADSALHHARRLGQDEQRLVEALHAYMYGRADEAETLYRRIVRRYPDHAEAWYHLGETLLHYNPQRGRPSAEARESFERAAALIPEQTESLLHLVQIATAERRFEDLDPLMDELLSRDIEERTRFHATRAFALGDTLAQERLLAEFRAGADHVVGAFWEMAAVLGDVDGAERLVRAWAQSEQGARSWRPDDWLERIALARGRMRRPDGELSQWAVLLPFKTLDQAELRAEREALEAWEVSVPAEPNEYSAIGPAIRSYGLGLVNARLGDVDAARRHAEAARQFESGVREADALADALSHSVLAEIAIQEGRSEAALRALEQASIEVPSTIVANSPFYALTRERFLHGELLLDLGRGDEALRWYASLNDRSTFGLPYLAPAALRMAEIEEARGEPERAAEHYATALELWENADPEFQPSVATARDRLARLVGERPAGPSP